MTKALAQSYSVVCDVCQCTFDAPRATKKRCSRACDLAAQRQRLRLVVRTRHHCICERCRAPYSTVETVSSFCSRSCAVSSHNAGSPKRKAHPPMACPECGTGVPNPANVFCGIPCYRAAQKKQPHLQAWIEGTAPASGKHGALLDSARQYMIDEAGEKCTECGCFFCAAR